MEVETVRVILERTFQMPVAESDAKIVLDWLNEILSDESRTTTDAMDGLWDCANCENRQIGGGFSECPNCGTARH